RSRMLNSGRVAWSGGKAKSILTAATTQPYRNPGPDAFALCVLLGSSGERREAEKEMSEPMRLMINGEVRTLEAPEDMPLLWVLRDLLGLTGTKFGCGIAQCGACTVHIDGKPVRSCMLPVGAVGNRPVTTIEGIGATPAGTKVQKAWL